MLNTASYLQMITVKTWNVWYLEKQHSEIGDVRISLISVYSGLATKLYTDDQSDLSSMKCM